MYALTTGDIRYIDEVTNAWKMYINPVLNSMETVPEPVASHIEELSEAFREGFFVFFRASMEKDETRLAGEVLGEFMTGWKKEHPDYYDMDQLFSGCSAEELKKAEIPLTAAREAFSV
jgi:hypothetical protein